MRLVTYEYQDQFCIGIVVGDQAVDLLAGMAAAGKGGYLPEDCDLKTFLGLEQGLEYALQVEEM